MGRVLNFLTNYIERRGIDDPNHWIIKVTEALSAKSGVRIDEQTAYAITAVFSCVRVISETVASLPLLIYRRIEDGGKELADDHYLYPILHNRPNSWQTSFEYREMQTGHTVLRGNSYSFIEKDKTDKVMQLIPLHPDKITIEVVDNALFYTWRKDDGSEVVLPQDEVLHIRGLSSDGYVGISPMQVHREAMGLAKVAEDHGAYFFKNGARTSGIVKLPGRLKEDAAKRLQESVQKAMTGENKFKVMMFEEGMDWVNVSINNSDAQWVEMRQFQIEEIARIFRVPCVLIGHADKTATYASAEQFFLSFVTHTIRPWLVRIEQSLNRSLLTEDEQSEYFIEHKIDGILRGDIQSRYGAYATGRQWGWLSVNDIRGLENMNPIKDGDVYLVPANMKNAEKLDEEPEPKIVMQPTGMKPPASDGEQDADAEEE